MKFRQLHPWSRNVRSAVELQERLRERIVLRPLPREPKLVAGADVSIDTRAGRLYAGAVVMELPDLEPLEVRSACAPIPFPYVPGLLSFREAPVLLDAFRKLACRPDVVLLDGQGLAHMRGLGLACHVGLWLGVPTVGCAKSRLVGEHREVAPERGRRATLRYRGRIVGTVLRTRDGVKPVYVSPGHLADVRSSAALVLRCARRFRLPEPTRAAHALVTRLRGSSAPAD